MIKTPKQALNKAYLKIKHSREQIDNFKQAVKVFFETSQTAKNESEQEHVTLIINFLNKSFYGNSNYVNINKKNDLVIRSNTSANSKIEILFEVKAPNNPTQMISKENINKKALQQLVLYYLREKITNKNDSIKYLIATNGMEWFIFDAQLFAKYFAHDKKLRAKFEEYINGRLDEVSTEHFYINIAKPAIEPLKDQLEYTYFNIEDYKKYIETNSAENDSKLIELYKIFSPEHLLKLPITNDNNSLNQKFYSELLHIIGLEETKQGSKKIITRKSPDRRNDGSLLESCIYTLDVANFENPIQYGDNKEEQLFNIALELVITWVNRILFLKLLEAQLISFHQGDKSYSFLNPDRLKSYQELNALFFNVLAIKNEERDSKDKVKFPYIPYLNSSLFEKTNLEISGSLISQLDSNEKLAVFNNTVLNDSSNKRLTGEENTLTYLLEFLNAYNFSGDDGDIIQGENKTIINASVLGLIFEKINGYKDGSFFTPSFITMYMCRETIRRAVVDKFKTIEPSIESFDDVKAYTSRYYKSKDIQQFNELINSLTICDPAVGSGHFLVSALNEIIAIKSELGILLNDSNELLNIGVDVINDELVITERSGDLFKYYPNNPASQQIQKTLFHEKQTIIENCLFGVDINPNSVKICRLRLWIELLKNAYYKDFANNELETLPNIDINIKCGNSLISRFDLVDNIESLLSNLKHGNHKNITVDYYRKKVLEYKNAKTKDQKRDLETLIKKIKQEFSAGLYQASLFDEDNKQSEKEAFYNKQNAFEWRFEFPEVLADNGEYKGFDIVIGNPPYIKEYEGKHIFDGLRNNPVYQGKMDIWYMFTANSMKLINKSGYLNFIATNNWVTNSGASKMRNYMLQNSKFIELIDFGAYMIFDSASVQTMIMLFQNKIEANYSFNYMSMATKTPSLNDVLLLIQKNDSINVQNLTPNIKVDNLLNKTLTFNNNLDDAILAKMIAKSNFYCNEAEVAQGIVFPQDILNRKAVDILGGNFQIGDGVFSLKNNEKNSLNLSEDELQFIKPYFTSDQLHQFYGSSENNRWLIYTPSNFNQANSMDDYPQLKSHLDKFSVVITSDNKPYGLHRARNENYFNGEKIISLRKCAEPTFTYTDFPCYVSQTYFVIKPDRINLKYLTGLLNSKLIAFWLRRKGKMQGNNFQIDKEPLLDIPLINTEISKQDEIVCLVNQILDAKRINLKADTSKLEQQIDELVYQLYDLTPEEISIIEEMA